MLLTCNRHIQYFLPDMSYTNRERRRSAFAVASQPRLFAHNIPCRALTATICAQRTSTATLCGQHSLPDLDRDPLRPAFPAGPTYISRYISKNISRNDKKNIKKNIRRSARKNVRKNGRKYINKKNTKSVRRDAR